MAALIMVDKVTSMTRIGEVEDHLTKNMTIEALGEGLEVVDQMETGL